MSFYPPRRRRGRAAAAARNRTINQRSAHASLLAPVQQRKTKKRTSRGARSERKKVRADDATVLVYGRKFSSPFCPRRAELRLLCLRCSQTAAPHLNMHRFWRCWRATDSMFSLFRHCGTGLVTPMTESQRTRARGRRTKQNERVTY